MVKLVHIDEYSRFDVQMLSTKNNPSLEEISGWKEKSYAEYLKANPEIAENHLHEQSKGGKAVAVDDTDEGSLEGGDGKTGGSLAKEQDAAAGDSNGQQEEELHPDWHHPYLGIKCFIEKHVSVLTVLFMVIERSDGGSVWTMLTCGFQHWMYRRRSGGANHQKVTLLNGFAWDVQQ